MSRWTKLLHLAAISTDLPSQTRTLFLLLLSPLFLKLKRLYHFCNNPQDKTTKMSTQNKPKPTKNQQKKRRFDEGIPTVKTKSPRKALRKHPLIVQTTQNPDPPYKIVWKYLSEKDPSRFTSGQGCFRFFSSPCS